MKDTITFEQLGINLPFTIDGSVSDENPVRVKIDESRYIHIGKSGATCLDVEERKTLMVNPVSLEPNSFFDKYDEKITIGCSVICDKTDDNEEFQGTVERFETNGGGFVVVLDQEDDAFCIEADKLEVIQ